MRIRTLIWVPFVFSVGGIAWGFLLAGVLVLAAVVLAPAIRDVKGAEAVRNEYQATLDLLDQQIALQKDFIEAAGKDPVLMERLAARQLNLSRTGIGGDQEILVLDSGGAGSGAVGGAGGVDRSVKTLLAESLKPVTVKKVEPLNPLLAMTLNREFRTLLVIGACGAIALSFFLGVRYERV